MTREMVAIRRLRWKRPLDLILVVVAVLPALLLCAVVAVLVAIRLGRPVLFIQERPGLGGRPFRLVKFRTMRPSRPGTDLPDADRLTPFGRWLRSTSLDELPELWNVLRGEMSFVGPRPLLMEYLPLYNPEQATRMSVPPGITGWAQIGGRNAVSWPEKLKLDAWYAANASLALDLRILARTAIQVALRKDISQPGHVTAERFRGNV